MSVVQHECCFISHFYARVKWKWDNKYTCWDLTCLSMTEQLLHESNSSFDYRKPVSLRCRLFTMQQHHTQPLKFSRHNHPFLHHHFKSRPRLSKLWPHTASRWLSGFINTIWSSVMFICLRGVYLCLCDNRHMVHKAQDVHYLPFPEKLAQPWSRQPTEQTPDSSVCHPHQDQLQVPIQPRWMQSWDEEDATHHVIDVSQRGK
jgi:hypothetical protein